MKPMIAQNLKAELDARERELNRLAREWRSTKSQQTLHKYQHTLREMIELGYRDSLDVDAELPDEYMPVEYLNLHS